MRDRLGERGFSGSVPIFPLPGAVLFPGVEMPLHVFEPRYKAMLATALAGEGLIAIATLAPGWEDDETGAPKFHPLATVGVVQNVEALPDGRSNITLLGLERVRLEEEFSDAPFRSARARFVPDRDAPDARDPEARDAIERLMTAFGYLLQLQRPDAPPTLFATDSFTFEEAVHTVCQVLDVPVERRLEALAADGPLERLPFARAWLGEKLDAALEERGLLALAIGAGESN
jgi:Lon protease-like protein